MTSRDAKASYDKIVFPPAETSSYRKGQYRAVEAIEAPDASTIRFRLKWPEASFLMTLASTYGWIYKADILAKDIRWYEKNVMGTGPFTFVEHVKGSHWIGKKNPNYWDRGKLAGYWRDIKASRAEARRLLREAGIPEGFSFVFKNRGIPQPYEPLGIWLIDQWRQIGLSVRQETIEASAYHPMLQRGDFDVAMDFQCSFVVEPDMDIDKFQSVGISDRNFGRYKDPVLDDLFMKQARALDPEERKRYLRAFEKRLLDEEAHYLWTLQNHRIVPHSAKVRGWTITPSHFLNQQLDTVWLAE